MAEDPTPRSADPADPAAPEEAPQPDAAQREFRFSPGDLDIGELAEFMAVFNQETQKLKESHDRLRGRLEEITGELKVKNEELSARLDEISALKNYLANILESITDGVLTLTPERQLVALNRAAARLLPPAAVQPAGGAEAAGTRLESLTGAGGLPVEAALGGRCKELAAILLRAMEEEAAVEPVEVAVTDEAGESRALSVSASPIRTRQGVVLGAVATFRDNTELRRLEEVLRRRERLAALGEMAAQLAHEIRNPLGGIDLYASLLFRALEDQPSEQDLARKVATATSSLNRLVEDMLTFTRPAELKRAKVRCGDLLDGAVELAGQTVAEQEVQVRRRYNESAPVWLDPDLMQRAFLNVILNAAQMTPAGGVLELATEVRGRGAGPEPATLVARIADAGPGVPAAMRDKIFNPFFTTRDGGTGLGLAIVHKIVQEHGGTVTVEDNEPTGAAFVFELPVETG